MITHYLKVALRNLLKYKAHSFISAICLAIGITCFCLTNYFIDIVTAQTDLPDLRASHQPGLLFGGYRSRHLLEIG